MNEANLALFWYWIREREAIRIAKESGAPEPWTGDGIMNKYHFCNVRREDDRGTKEIRAVVRHHIHNEDLLPWAYTLARLFNSAKSLEVVLGAHNLGLEPFSFLKEIKRRGGKVFHTAYVVSTCGQRMDKIDYVADVARQVKKLQVPRVGLQDAFEALRNVPGMGSFLAAQVVADLRNDRYLTPKSRYEEQHWSAIGPGSKKGLAHIFGPVADSNYRGYMQALYSVMPDDIAAMDIHAQDLQNCLCEFSKYMRHRNGEGGRIRYYK